MVGQRTSPERYMYPPLGSRALICFLSLLMSSTLSNGGSRALCQVFLKLVSNKYRNHYQVGICETVKTPLWLRNNKSLSLVKSDPHTQHSANRILQSRRILFLVENYK